MKSNIELPDLGELVYGKVYFAVEKPIIFQCTFSKERRTTWLATHVEEFDAEKWQQKSERVNNYFLTPITSSILQMLESGEYTLAELYGENSVLFISHRFCPETNKHSTIYQYYSTINPVYRFAENATLAI